MNRTRRQAVASLLAGTIALLAPAARAVEATQAESDEAFRIFLNVKDTLVQRCIYQPTEGAVLTGVLRALERELDPEFAPDFPETLPPDFRSAFLLAQKSLRRLAAQPALGSRTLRSLVEQGIRGYLRKLDRYSDYDDREAVSMEAKLKSKSYVGVGMTIERSPLGIDLFPFPGGPADLAGCLPGDRLLEIDGRSVRGLGRLEVGQLFSGELGTSARVKIAREGSREQVLGIPRSQVSPESITVEQERSGPVVRLRRLVPGALEELRSFLRTVRPGGTFTLDLRGCPGGEFAVAVSVAELFLPKDSPICTLETREGLTRYKSANQTPFRAANFVILQNRGTMSGAELIIAALTGSPTVRADNRGERTYGKGVTLSVDEIGNGGGHLRYADGRMLGPNGAFWDQEGLPPASESAPRP